MTYPRRHIQQNPEGILRGISSHVLPSRSRPVPRLCQCLKAVSFDSISWIIVGGESGPRYREMKIDWVREVRERCQAQSNRILLENRGWKIWAAGG